MTAQSRKNLIGVFGLFVAGQVAAGVLFSLPFGPVQGTDSYLSIAQRFPDLTGTEWGYGGYVTILAFGEALGSGQWFAFILQCLAAVGAGTALLSLGRRFGGEFAGWAAAGFYLVHPLVAQWTSYLLTESIFYSGVIVVAWCLVHAIDTGRPSWGPLWLTALLVATMRPNGMILLGSVASVTAIHLPRPAIARLALVASIWGAVLMVGVISPTLSTGSESNYFGPRAWAGEVVWNVPEERMTMPQPATRDPSNGAFIQYAIAHPVEIAELGARRVWWELKQVRPWYSRGLNAFTGVSMSGFYILAAIGAWKSRNSTLTLIVAGITIPFMGLIALTWAIWEGRFGWWFLVLWTMWAGIGGQTVIDNGRRWVSSLSRHQPLPEGPMPKSKS